jgi:hypothetical protein
MPLLTELNQMAIASYKDSAPERGFGRKKLHDFTIACSLVGAAPPRSLSARGGLFVPEMRRRSSAALPELSVCPRSSTDCSALRKNLLPV